ncbi:hypothetical protein MMC25_003218 [Agyrium rufum]|nr:hypothetical protein [Agyrium rufum]
MRGAKIFSGSSHPSLTDAICERLGTTAAQCDLGKFSNGETSVSINTSIRNQDVFIVQSGSPRMNDSIMELLIMISSCKGASAKSITAVIPYFPYSRQSKKKSHRGAITARMLANLLSVAGVEHVITMDLHAAPMQGFFGKPVDNLHAEPMIAKWIRTNVPEWQEAVVVSKNAGGTKRVTSLADALKLNFAMVTTDRRREPNLDSHSLEASMLFATLTNGNQGYESRRGRGRTTTESSVNSHPQYHQSRSPTQRPRSPHNGNSPPRRERSPPSRQSNSNIPATTNSHPRSQTHRRSPTPTGSSPLVRSQNVDSISPPLAPSPRRHPLLRRATAPPSPSASPAQDPVASPEPVEEYTDERARDVITGRLIQGHIVDDDFPSPILSTISSSTHITAEFIGPSHFDSEHYRGNVDFMTSSIISNASSLQLHKVNTSASAPAMDNHALGGSYDAGASSDEEEAAMRDPEVEQTITLVGNVRGRTVFIIDDMIDRSGSWIAAAETVVKRGGAEKVYLVATHGLFGDGALEELEECDCVDWIVVTNTFPIPEERVRRSRKLVVLDCSMVLAEAIRRNHYGESISVLYQHV